MSYDKDIGNYTVKFKDEISYLEAKLENLKLYSDIPLIGFIQNEMYDGSKCEVESIDPVQYTSGNQVYVSSDTIYGGNLIGFTSGGGNQSETVSASSYDTYTTDIDYGVGTGDVHVSGNLIVDGSITWGGDSNFSPGPGNFEQPGIGNPAIFTTPEIPKEEPPEDPIDNRFDILDL